MVGVMRLGATFGRALEHTPSGSIESAKDVLNYEPCGWQNPEDVGGLCS